MEALKTKPKKQAERRYFSHSKPEMKKSKKTAVDVCKQYQSLSYKFDYIISKDSLVSRWKNFLREDRNGIFKTIRLKSERPIRLPKISFKNSKNVTVIGTSWSRLVAW